MLQNTNNAPIYTTNLGQINKLSSSMTTDTTEHLNKNLYSNISHQAEISLSLLQNECSCWPHIVG